MTNNKGIGMSEGEWNQITVKNAESFKQEAIFRKQKLIEQKEQTRKLLAEQV